MITNKRKHMNMNKPAQPTKKRAHHAAPLAVVAVALLLTVAAGCCANAKPLQRHAELEWEMRERMPQWGPLEWNAWEASLAAALNKPEPEVPLFPEAAPQDEEVSDEDE